MPPSQAQGEWIFTFGFGQVLPDGSSGACKFTRIRAETRDEARELMNATWGRMWAFQYDSEEAAGVERYGLTEVKP